MSVVTLYNNIYRTLANDETVLDYLGITNDKHDKDILIKKAQHIQKRSRPQRLADSLPLITFYAPPGGVQPDNHLVYDTDFIFDIYTNDDVQLAQQIGERIAKLFVDKLRPVSGLTNFAPVFVSSYESDVPSLQNVYCFTVVINFSISIETYYNEGGNGNG